VRFGKAAGLPLLLWVEFEHILEDFLLEGVELFPSHPAADFLDFHALEVVPYSNGLRYARKLWMEFEPNG